MSTPGRRADAVRNRRLALEAATALLAEPDAALTVEAIARKAGLGVGTVARAFGGKDALLDAAVAQLLEPVVRRGRDLLQQTGPEQALRTFLTELIGFQAAHHPISDQLRGMDTPATAALRAQLVEVVEEMLAGARRDGVLRTDIDLATTTALIGRLAFAVARARPGQPQLAEAFITVVMDGLRPPSSPGPRTRT
ncbi:TetR/AcrR family transcriptional regulator [Microbispora rosea]|uniref:TetR/AcrR family transcriptional regulator n=1 Tax=Microbispora rosea TaxID=58117 RepID=UPI00343BFC7E